MSVRILREDAETARIRDIGIEFSIVTRVEILSGHPTVSHIHIGTSIQMRGRTQENERKNDDLIERQREYFNSIAGRYHEGSTGLQPPLPEGSHWRDVSSRIPRLEGLELDVLEPMCGFCDGYGLVRRHLASQIRLSGFDYSGRRVVETVKKDNPDLDVWQADATKYRPAADSCDLIILIAAFITRPWMRRRL